MPNIARAIGSQRSFMLCHTPLILKLLPIINFSLFNHLGSFGIKIVNMRYAIIPLANAKLHTTKSSRTSFGSTSKCFAMPPHTPVNTLPSLILYNFLAAIIASLLADNLIIGPGCQQINKQVHNCKHHIAYHCAGQEQLDIQKIEQRKQLVNDRECYCDMEPCDNQR